jgi:hypothetical protein
MRKAPAEFILWVMYDLLQLQDNPEWATSFENWPMKLLKYMHSLLPDLGVRLWITACLEPYCLPHASARFFLASPPSLVSSSNWAWISLDPHHLTQLQTSGSLRSPTPDSLTTKDMIRTLRTRQYPVGYWVGSDVGLGLWTSGIHPDSWHCRERAWSRAEARLQATDDQ